MRPTFTTGRPAAIASSSTMWPFRRRTAPPEPRHASEPWTARRDYVGHRGPRGDGDAACSRRDRYGWTVGVGYPLSVGFNTAVKNRAAVEKALFGLGVPYRQVHSELFTFV